jgi:iron-sulfur cluster assembly accessory protein
MDIKLSKFAWDKIMQTVEEYNEEPILRIYVESAACSGARFGIAFDYIKKEDDVTEVEGVKFITDKEYVPKYSDGLDVDYVTMPKEGFIIKSLRPVEKSGCGCGSKEGGGCGSGSGCGH